MTEPKLSHLADSWSDTEAQKLLELEQLAYQSRLLGAEPRLVLWGGGNTSLKVVERDFRGRECQVLRIKGTGTDMKYATVGDFPAVRMEDLLALFERNAMSDEAMAEYLRFAMLDPGAQRPSIETLLHAFIPSASVVHSHADAILALTNNVRSAAALSEVFGDDIIVLPYIRPGFVLSRLVGQAVRDRAGAQGVVLQNHGLITWHDEPGEAYRQHIRLVNRAIAYIEKNPEKNSENSAVSTYAISSADQRRQIAARFAPYLRGLLGQDGPLVVRFDDSEEILRLVAAQSYGADRLQAVIQAGAATPDHILNIKRIPLWIDASDLADPHSLQTEAQAALAAYVRQYRAYYDANHHGEPMLSPLPRIVLVAGLGMFSTGKDSRAAAISHDIYQHTIAITGAAERVGAYRSLNLEDGFNAEYWPLELYKLTLAPPPKRLSGCVALITGAAGAIGAAIASRFASEGAHVVCADIDPVKTEALVAQLRASAPHNTALAVTMDVTNEASVRAAYERIALEYGGLDILVSNAGIALNGPLDELTLESWERSFAVNTTGHFLVARETLALMKTQRMGGSIIFIATKNVPAPGKDFGAYSASKAAQAQLGRVLALEGGAFGIRSNMINPDAIFGASGLWSPQVRADRARSYHIEPEELEDFYRKRNLLQVEVTAQDVAEAALFFAGKTSAKTTGSMLPVDGGLREAFPR